MLKQSLKEFTNLTEPQRHAVMTDHAKVAVVACPGSGKTTVLVKRIQYLVSKGVSPKKICALTFTNKAAEEMRERLSKDLHGGKQVTCKTFHSLGIRIIKDFGTKLGLPRNPTIYDEQDRKDIMSKILQETGLKVTKRNLDSAYKSRFFDTHYCQDRDARTVVKEYTARLKAQGALDFDMIIMEAVNILSLLQKAAQHYHDRYDYILIDEAQDTDRLQHEMIGCIDPKNLFYVSDIDQCIYEWRAANPERMLEILGDDSFEVHRLEESHRCTYQIAEVANSVIGNNVKRFEKDIRTKKDGSPVRWLHFKNRYEEAEFIWVYVDSLVEKKGIESREIFVLARTNRIIRYMEKIYHEKSRPYQIDTTAKHADMWMSLAVRSMISTLKLIVNRQSSYLAESSIFAMSSGYAIDRIVYGAIHSGHSVCNELQKSDPWMESFMDKVDGDSDVFEVVNQMVNYLTTVLDRMGLATQTKMAWGFVNFLFKWRIERESSTVQSFLDWNMSRSLQDSIDFQKDTVKLMTVHAAKGLEAEYVIIAGLEDDVFPSRRSDIEEERRLFYVAVTRAKERLVLCYNDSQPSQFIEEAEA